MNLVFSILFIFGLIGLICVLWRFASNYYSLPCPVWLSGLVEMDNPFIKIAQAQTIVSNAHVKEGMKVLDMGCGPGRVVIPLAKAVGNQGVIVAMDIQEEMLKKVQSRVKKEGLSNVVYLHAGLGNGVLEKHEYDCIVMVTVLGEIPNQETAFEELYRSLKVGGTLSITEFIADPHFQRQFQVKDLAKEVGFKEVALYGSWYAYTMNFTKIR